MRYDAVTMGGWSSPLTTAMKAITAGVPGGGSALTDRVVDMIHARYVSLLNSGYQLPRYVTAAGDEAARVMLLKLSADSGYSTPLIRAFLVSLYNLAKSAKVPEVKYDPVGYARREAQRIALDPSSKSVTARITDAAGAAAGAVSKIGIGLVLLAALGAAVYFKIGRK